MGFGTTNGVTADFQLYQLVSFVDRGRNAPLFRRFAGDVIHTRNRITNLDGFNRFFAKRCENGSACNEAERGIHRAANAAHDHAREQAILRTLYSTF